MGRWVQIPSKDGFRKNVLVEVGKERGQKKDKSEYRLMQSTMISRLGVLFCLDVKRSRKPGLFAALGDVTDLLNLHARNANLWY